MTPTRARAGGGSTSGHPRAGGASTGGHPAAPTGGAGPRRLSPTGVAKAVALAPLELARSLHPHREQSDLARVAFYATLTGLVVADVLEPPLALVVGVAHALASSRSPTVRGIGEGLEEAGG